ncbi:SHOCT domain-containing protein [Spirosoma foliorum]|uniref:SHOCT domain-containing protein n=2 Tax=Spirosoma foliorum TaxID=2710596 RepID=A0A7G5H7R8_9BACT|nr:SHOCT domain-containing protein [Spirosoma foliorum]
MLLCYKASYSQIPGKRFDKTISVGNYEISPGDTLYLGKGSMNGGLFAYIEQPANYIVGLRAMSLDSRYAGKFVIVKFFKVQKDKNTGEKVFAVINPTGAYNYSVDIQSAIDVGEIVAINHTMVGARPQATSSTVSVADELLKLKQLLDAGALTQAEYDQQKKKLLNN